MRDPLTLKSFEEMERASARAITVSPGNVVICRTYKLKKGDIVYVATTSGIDDDTELKSLFQIMLPPTSNLEDYLEDENTIAADCRTSYRDSH